MAAALRTVVREQGGRLMLNNLTLIGHSGGGTLAMLLAARMDGVRAVVTLAGNLDPDAWGAYHGYEPLHGLSPAREPPLSPMIRQIHCIGGRDRNIPPALLQAALTRSPQAELRVFPDFDHACCWEKAWPSLLRALKSP
jgi:pimeloyl-ACP methyl ester carboxylesterase